MEFINTNSPNDLLFPEEPACYGMDTNLFFPYSERREDGLRQAKEAKAVCKKCPIAKKCLEYALSQPSFEDHGIWGDTTSRERRKMRAEMRLQKNHR